MTKCQQIFAPTRQICHLNLAHQPIASLITRPFPTSTPPPHSLRTRFPPPRTPPHSLRTRFPPPRTPPHSSRARFPPPPPRLTHYAPDFHPHAPPHSLHACFPSLRTPPHSLRARFPPPCAPDIYSTIKRQNFILKSENYIKTILLPNMAKPYLPRKGFHQLAHTIFPRLARHIKKSRRNNLLRHIYHTRPPVERLLFLSAQNTSPFMQVRLALQVPLALALAQNFAQIEADVPLSVRGLKGGKSAKPLRAPQGAWQSVSEQRSTAP